MSTDTTTTVVIDDKSPTLLEVEKNYLNFLKLGFDALNGIYLWPVSPDLLTQLLRMSPHHEAAIDCKAQTVAIGYRPHQKNQLTETDFEQFLSLHDLEAFVFDFLLYGNATLEQVPFRFAPEKIACLRHTHARTMYRAEKPGHYKQLLNGEIKREFRDNVIHAKIYAPEHSEYGLPRYLGAVLDIYLNRGAKLLRLRYLDNGAHLGYIVILNKQFTDRDDKGQSAKENALIERIKAARGVGNGQSIYLNFSGLEGFDVAKNFHIERMGTDLSKDDFNRVIDCTQEAICTAHRIPPDILSMVQDSQKASPNLDKVVMLYNKNVVAPLQRAIKTAINTHLPPEKWIDFDPYVLPGESDALSKPGVSP